MNMIYQGNDIYEVHFDDGLVTILNKNQIEELVETCESTVNLDNEYNDLVDRNKDILKSIEEASGYLRELDNSIEKIRRTKIKEELKSIKDDVDSILSQWL